MTLTIVNDCSPLFADSRLKPLVQTLAILPDRDGDDGIVLPYIGTFM